jgi:hypothetical protein
VKLSKTLEEIRKMSEQAEIKVPISHQVFYEFISQHKDPEQEKMAMEDFARRPHTTYKSAWYKRNCMSFVKMWLYVNQELSRYASKKPKKEYLKPSTRDEFLLQKAFLVESRKIETLHDPQLRTDMINAYHDILMEFSDLSFSTYPKGSFSMEKKYFVKFLKED